MLCAVRFNRPGFAVESGDKTVPTYSGMDIDFCRALAAGLFGNSAKPPVKFIDIASLAEGYDLLSAGKVDVMAGATWTLAGESSESHFLFSQPYLFRPKPSDE